MMSWDAIYLRVIQQLGWPNFTQFWTPTPIERKRFTHYSYLKSSPESLVLEFELWRYFDTKQKSKSFTLWNCVWLRWFCVIVWFTLNLNFWYLKLSKSADLSKPWGRFFQNLCVSQKVRTLPNLTKKLT